MWAVRTTVLGKGRSPITGRRPFLKLLPRPAIYLINYQTTIIDGLAPADQSQLRVNCTIVSPVRGVIIDRRVNIGQTVVASLNAPSLFLLAKDLRRMEVWVPVNEADIASIHPGQPVVFTVDARPGETFAGKVGKVRLNAAMTQNIVTYTVEVETDNSSGKLLPYLTANVDFQTARHSNVLMVPNSALRWTPAPDQVSAAYLKAKAGAAVPSSNRPSQRPYSNRTGKTVRARPRAKAGTVWVTVSDGVRPIGVKTGLTDEIMTEVESPELSQGMEVVTGLQTPEMASGPQGTTNPFIPQLLRNRQQGQGARGGSR